MFTFKYAFSFIVGIRYSFYVVIQKEAIYPSDENIFFTLLNKIPVKIIVIYRNAEIMNQNKEDINN